MRDKERDRDREAARQTNRPIKFRMKSKTMLM